MQPIGRADPIRIANLLKIKGVLPLPHDPANRALLSYLISGNETGIGRSVRTRAQFYNSVLSDWIHKLVLMHHPQDGVVCGEVISLYTYSTKQVAIKRSLQGNGEVFPFDPLVEWVNGPDCGKITRPALQNLCPLAIP